MPPMEKCKSCVAARTLLRVTLKEKPLLTAESVTRRSTRSHHFLSSFRILTAVDFHFFIRARGTSSFFSRYWFAKESQCYQWGIGTGYPLIGYRR